jgi:hypothetical protein
MGEHQLERVAGESLGIDLTQASTDASSGPGRQAAVICPFPGLPANRCCRSYPCRRLPPGAEQPLPGLDNRLA